MPCDTRRYDVNYNAYIEVMEEVERVISNEQTPHVMFGGDLNTDLSRQSPHSVYLERFVVDLNMVTCIDIDHAQVSYTYIDPLSASRIDHVLVSGIGGKVTQCGIIDNHLHSDHVPIKVEFDFSIDHVDLIDRLHQPKLAWWREKADHLKTFKERSKNF